ncbi:MAG: hypothetical protein JW934_12695 [Anaerolineae bacterium]|nr:hypothetical protein [Anaerolineae bacterium]
MEKLAQPIYVGECRRTVPGNAVAGEYVTLWGEPYYCIRNYDQMPPFFMSIVSSTDHWLFISSTGGLTAGRKDAQSALFPYTTDDKVTDNAATTGVLALVVVTRGSRTHLWTPLSARYAGLYRITRNLYKNGCGNKLLFEEINHDLGLTYRYAWRTSDRYGFVKTTWLKNDAADDGCTVRLLDGLQNLLPCGATTALQDAFSNLLNAYKRNELDPETGLGMFSLSSTLTDQAEPSESLMATTVWQVGLANAMVLLSTRQVEHLERGLPVTQECDLRGTRGAYLVCADLALAPGAEQTWSLVAEVNQDSRCVVALRNMLKQQTPAKVWARLEADIARCTADLTRIVAQADGLQTTGDTLGATHHFANVLFNTMRGGIFADNYYVGKADWGDFLRIRNRPLLAAHADLIAALPERITVDDLLARATGTPALERLCYEYLPLTFSRRHGDPSRPWNQFSINVKKPDGSQKLDYQGNWRDIFQNWEPLAYAYPEFVEGMMARFLNATTVDGYNPYRVTRDGVEWEEPNPHSPWANIGYWSDHQIIYLQKLLQVSARYHPAALPTLLNRRIFSHANVPYRIKPYAALLADYYNTIEFDWALEAQIKERVQAVGTDGKLVWDAAGQVLHVNLAEKLLTLLFAKLVNFVPEGGVWMNTQRPEWNDANNALVGKGLSVVTTAYLRRFIVFCRALLTGSALDTVDVTQETHAAFTALARILKSYQPVLSGDFTNRQRRAILDDLGQAGSDYRWGYYRNGLSGVFVPLGCDAILAFLDLTQQYVEHTLRANARPDRLYHAYNILFLGADSASVGRLYEMLEGQVAILSSGLLSGEQSLALLSSLRHSALYRTDQHSYILYPDRNLPGMLRKNTVPAEWVQESALVAALDANSDPTLLIRDADGDYHFSGRFRNARDVQAALDALKQKPQFAPLVAAEAERVLDWFERVFNHSAFTGRSGTFFAYEGLGSIYWHMVSKLLLAVQETYLHAAQSGEPEATVRALADVYYDIRQGLGFNKSPDAYGAFPTDPYSHTPAGQGAKQPGMTGMVKEEILTRWGELGVGVAQGKLVFDAALLRESEFLSQATPFEYVDVAGATRAIPLPAGSLAYTFCQVPIVYIADREEKIDVYAADGRVWQVAGLTLDTDASAHIFRRDGVVRQLTVHLAADLE